jgi:integrase
LNGKSRDMGLGASRDVSLVEARLRAAEYRRLCRQGIDPLEAQAEIKLATTKEEAASATASITFEQCAKEYINARRSSWKSDKSAPQWESSLRTYVYKTLGNLPVKDVTPVHVIGVLEPIWKSKYETASRLRGRIEAILEWALANDYRAGVNPAKWHGRVKVKLGALTPRREEKHHNALPYSELPAFMAKLRSQGGMPARALEFIILTAARRREVLEACWGEIDFSDGAWTVPAKRMKVGKEHQVPLSFPAMKLLKSLAEEKKGDLIFPNVHTKAPLSDMAIASLLERMGRDDITTHGFRSSFRDWIAQKTNFSGEVAEMALAHTIGNKVEAAYRRGDLFDKRRVLMDAWAHYCDQRQAKPEVGSIAHQALAPA